MKNWSPWRCVRTSSKEADITFQKAVPVAYELGIGAPGPDGTLRRIYIDKTDDGHRRLGEYVSGNSHIESKIRLALDAGDGLWWRSWECEDKARAKNIQDALLMTRTYPWNTQGNS